MAESVQWFNFTQWFNQQRKSGRIFIFFNEDIAKAFRNRGNRGLGMQIVLGDDYRYWVCTSGVAEKFIRMGYEVL